MSGVTAAAMVCAGLLSVILFPVAALALLRPRQRDRKPHQLAPMQDS